MNFIRQIALGQNLTALTNIVEEMAAREASTPAGISGLDCWPLSERGKVQEEFNRRVDKLSKVPRHVVTEELAKNMRLAMQLGRSHRAMCVSRLLEMLVERNAALSMDEFARSYA